MGGGGGGCCLKELTRVELAELGLAKIIAEAEAVSRYTTDETAVGKDGWLSYVFRRLRADVWRVDNHIRAIAKREGGDADERRH